jgi:hypothetical protein
MSNHPNDRQNPTVMTANKMFENVENFKYLVTTLLLLSSQVVLIVIALLKICASLAMYQNTF